MVRSTLDKHEKGKRRIEKSIRVVEQKLEQALSRTATGKAEAPATGGAEAPEALLPPTATAGGASFAEWVADAAPPPLPPRPQAQGLPSILGVLDALNPLRLLPAASANANPNADTNLRAASFVRASSAPVPVQTAADSFNRF